MKRTLSSLQTFIFKFIFPVVWISGWGMGTASMFLNPQNNPDVPPRGLFLLLWFVGVAVILWSCVRLKKVSVDENFLYVSNYLKEISIPLSDIYDVTENIWVNIHPVTIHLRSPSDFGHKIYFMPQAKFTFFSSHPVVKELKEMARAKQTAGLNFVR
ncbi:MAG TPA: hypothetical protein VGO96_09220 [Pyrinomonadaceae bacterium]|jgi:hypothetical protein|nr:hypothetical protein [Pyrinomonadaceae bacterium]